MDPYTELERLERAGLDLMACSGPSENVDLFVETDRWAAAGHRLAQLARTLSGDEFSTWSYPGLEGPAPVVFLGDGDPSLVADSVDDFLRLLGTGRVWEDGWTHTHLEPKEQRAVDALQRRLERGIGTLSGTPEEALQRATERHPDFWNALTAHAPPPRPIQVYRWWFDFPPKELEASIAPYKAGDAAEAYRRAAPRVSDATSPRTLASVAQLAAESGDHQAAYELYTRADYIAEARFELIELGRGHELVEPILAIALDPARGPEEAAAELRYLTRVVEPEVLAQHVLDVDRQRRWGDETVQRLRAIESLQARLERAWSERTELRAWPLGRATVDLFIAETALELGQQSLAVEVLDSVRSSPDLEDEITRIRAAIEAYQPPEQNDPLAPLFRAWREARDDAGKAEAGVLLAQALVEADRREEAWKPCWDAVGGLPTSHPAYDRMMQLAEELEKAGLDS